MTLAQITIAASQLEKQRTGYQAVSLTNFDNDNEPQITQGSLIEIGSALFEASANENITGWAGIGNSNDVYIKLVVAGALATAEFTLVAPTWSTSKQGWYDGLDRYIGGLYKDAGGNYTDKWLYVGGPEIRHGAIGSDAIRTDAIQDAAVTTAKINNGAITGPKLGTVFGSDGQHTEVGAGTWQPSAGWYMMASSPGIYVQIYFGGGWQTATQQFGGGLFVTDGSTVRLSFSGAGQIVYKKI